MEIKTIDYILPAYLADYLINGDVQGLSDNELNEVDYFMIINKLDSCISCSDYAEFKYSNDMNKIGNDCLNYTFSMY